MTDQGSVKGCTKCGVEFPATSEYFQKETRGHGLKTWCKSCTNEYSRHRYQSLRSRKPCSVEGCRNGVHNGEFCATHDRRKRLYGDPLGSSELYKKRRTGWIDPKGYRRFCLSINGQKRIVFEHRLVMERAIGRELQATETVHHRNGNRLDNRLENLELWNSIQPSGQRVKDLVAWAREILKLYEPQLALFT